MAQQKKKYYPISRSFLNDYLKLQGGVWELQVGTLYIDLNFSNSYTKDEVVEDLIDNFVLATDHDRVFTVAQKDSIKNELITNPLTVSSSGNILRDKNGNVKFYLVDGNTKEILCLDGWRAKDKIDSNYPPLLFNSREKANFYREENNLGNVHAANTHIKF